MPLLKNTGQGRTTILLSGAHSLDVMESAADVLGQLERQDIEWVVLMKDEEHSVHVRSSAVVGLVDVGHHE